MATTRNFSDLTEREVLALAISFEEEDERIYNEFSEGLRKNHPDSAKMFDALAQRKTATAIVCSISTANASASTSR